MKEVKRFYSKDRLNKGYINGPSYEPNSNPSSEIEKKYANNLPPIDIISAYEEIEPGILKKIITIAETEQKMRHSIDKINIEANLRAKRMGNFFGLLIGFTICFVSLKISDKSLFYSTIFSFIAFGSICFISYLQYKSDNRNVNENSNNHKRFRNKK